MLSVSSCSRSSLYCSDVVKMIGCPVIHVNGDYPEVSVVVYIHAHKNTPACWLEIAKCVIAIHT